MRPAILFHSYYSNRGSVVPTYFVSSSDGDDSNDGLTSETAWATVAKVNGSTFVAGDFVAFKRGDTWAEKLIIPSSGTEGLPIIFGAYGSGDNPLFNKTLSHGIDIAARNDVTIQDIDLTNTGTASNGANIVGSGVWTRITFQRMTLTSAGDYNILNTNNSVTVTVQDITAADTGVQCVRLSGAANSDITVSNVSGGGGTTTPINVINCANATITGITWVGGVSPINLNAITGTLELSDINLTSPTDNAIILTSCTAVLTADNVNVTDGVKIGIYFVSSALGIGSSISNSIFDNCTSGGVRINGSSNLTLTNVVSKDASGTADGFYMLGAWSTLVFDECDATGNGRDGFFFEGTGSIATLTDCLADLNLRDGFSIAGTVHDVDCTRCIASNNGIKTLTSAGDGFSAHSTTYNFNLKNCLAYGNTQSGLAMIETSQGTVYNCVFSDNGGAWLDELGGSNLNSVRANIYIGTTGINATTGTGWSIKNCITQNGYPVELLTLSTTRYDELAIDYNAYYHPDDDNVVSKDNLSTFLSWADYHTTAGEEANSINEDPLFTDAASDDYTLQVGSPCIDAGVDVGIAYLGDAPDIGAFERL